jgi:hypothetical protein
LTVNIASQAARRLQASGIFIHAEEARQELYRVAVRADGGAVREDDAEVEPLDKDGMLLSDGEVVAIAVKELPPFVWRTFAGLRSCCARAVSSVSIPGGGFFGEIRRSFFDNINLPFVLPQH